MLCLPRLDVIYIPGHGLNSSQSGSGLKFPIIIQFVVAVLIMWGLGVTYVIYYRKFERLARADNASGVARGGTVDKA